MPIDQAHETVVKGSGGAVGLTQNPSALRKWGLSKHGLFNNFWMRKKGDFFNRDEGFSTQKTLKLHVMHFISLVDAIKAWEVPF